MGGAGGPGHGGSGAGEGGRGARGGHGGRGARGGRGHEEALFWVWGTCKENTTEGFQPRLSGILIKRRIRGFPL